MTVRRYRSVEDMPRPWRAADDPGNLKAVAEMLALHRRLVPAKPPTPGVRRYRSAQEAEADRQDRRPR
jgi:hypothetical protein